MSFSYSIIMLGQSIKQLLLGTCIGLLSLHSSLSDDFSILQIVRGGIPHQLKSLTENVLTEVTNILLTPCSFVPNWELSPAIQILTHNSRLFYPWLALAQYGGIFPPAAAAVQIIY